MKWRKNDSLWKGVISIADYSEEELDKSENPFAQVILVARMNLLEGKVSEKELLRLKLAAARRLLAKGFSAKKTRAILRFLRNYVLFESKDTIDKFDNLYSESNKTNFMNWEEYDKWYAQMETLEYFVKRLLLKTDFTVEQVADMADTTVEFVEEAKEEVERYRAKYGDRYSG